MFQPRNLGKAEASLSADAAVILVFPEDGFLSPIIGTGREPGARVPRWILDAELQHQGLIFFRSHKSGVSVFISSKIFRHRAKLTGKLEKGRERALGSESLALLELLLAGLSSGEKNPWCWERP